MMIVTGRMVKWIAGIVFELIISKFHQCPVEELLVVWLFAHQFSNEVFWLFTVPQRRQVSQDVQIDF
jgi:hypothetical protein